MSLRDYSIRLRLIIGFSIMVVAVIIIGIISNNSLSKTKQIVNVSNHLEETQISLLNARLKVTYFMMYGDTENVNQVNQYIELALSHVDSSQLYSIYNDQRSEFLKNTSSNIIMILISMQN